MTDGEAHRASVLLVDDSRVQALTTRLALEREGFSVLVLNDSADAIETVRREHPDLVVSDLHMPGIDGAQLCRLLHSDPELGSIPVVLISASSDSDADASIAHEVGAIDFIDKRASTEEIARRLRAALGQSGLQP